MAAKKYVLYADGACEGNPGPGGWGVVITEPEEERREFSGGPVPSTTNNRMELAAAIEGLKATEPGAEVILRTDSQYLVKTMTLGWRRNANQDLWAALDREVAKRKVGFQWVRGHAGDRFNERADELANKASKGQKPRPLLVPLHPAGAEPSAAESIDALLKPGEAVKTCASCKRELVSTAADEVCCSLVRCQLRARRPRATTDSE